jgi:uncharacterized membrane protein
MAFADTQQTDERQGATDVNVSRAERLFSALAGGAAVAYAFKERGLGRLATAAAGGALVYRGITGHCPLYGAFDISTAGDTRNEFSGSRGVNVTESIQIDRPIDEVYGFWRRLENLPTVMSHLESVTPLGAGRSHWVARGPLGIPVAWDAEIINEVPNTVIAWASLEGADVTSAGSVNFDRSRDGGTQVTVRLQYSAPGGKVADAVTRMLGESPAQQIKDDLQRFKMMMESGAAPYLTVGPGQTPEPW